MITMKLLLELAITETDKLSRSNSYTCVRTEIVLTHLKMKKNLQTIYLKIVYVYPFKSMQTNDWC